MTTLQDLLSKVAEVYEPFPEDEVEFKDKHHVSKKDHPLNDKATLNQTKFSPRRKKRVADNDLEDAEDMYEARGKQGKAGPRFQQHVKDSQRYLKEIDREIKAYVKRAPDSLGDVHWGHVGTMADTSAALRQIADSLLQRGEYAEEVESDDKQESLDEAKKRGRPKKGEGDFENIQMQLRKSISLRGMKDVMFTDGKSVQVKPGIAQAVLDRINKIRDAKDKQSAVIHIAKSYNNLLTFAKNGSFDKHTDEPEPEDVDESVFESTANLDPVDKKELKGKHKDRTDKDIDNDGDVDDSDKYLHKRRKAVSKAVAKESFTQADDRGSKVNYDLVEGFADLDPKEQSLFQRRLRPFIKKIKQHAEKGTGEDLIDTGFQFAIKHGELSNPGKVVTMIKQLVDSREGDTQTREWLTKFVVDHFGMNATEKVFGIQLIRKKGMKE